MSRTKVIRRAVGRRVLGVQGLVRRFGLALGLDLGLGLRKGLGLGLGVRVRIRALTLNGPYVVHSNASSPHDHPYNVVLTFAICEEGRRGAGRVARRR